MNSGKLALGVLAVAATGALFGFLYAPSKATALRRKINRIGDEEIDILKDKFNEFVKSMTHNFEKVKESVIDFAQESLTKAEEKVKTAKNN